MKKPKREKASNPILPLDFQPLEAVHLTGVEKQVHHHMSKGESGWGPVWGFAQVSALCPKCWWTRK